GGCVRLEMTKLLSILLKGNDYFYTGERRSLSACRGHRVELPSERSNISPVSTDWHSHQGTMV
ncbi:hypothetical protein JX616_27700, partial [Klebsiella pneumoniae]|uniref:hypothetical protein n=1 Tax=Klebsiella pneumoniae TaxID=573 RepID=UPI0019D3EB52